MAAPGVKQKLDELYDLLQANYISEEEFQAGKRNILRNAGLDISDRCYDHDDEPVRRPPRESRTTPPPRKQGRGCGCGCLSSLLLLILILAGAILSLPEDLVKELPRLEKLFGEQHVHAARQELRKLLDKWLGSESPELPPMLQESRDVLPLAVPAPPISQEPIPPTPPISPDGESEPQKPSEQSRETPDPKLDALSDIPKSPRTVRAFIAVSSARLRPNPGSKRILARAVKGDPLIILEEATDEDGALWYRVQLERDGKEGWLSGAQVEKTELSE
ncbi:MAG: SH3 domain-containing protein [Fretibacterium sp.]|nr:SH3 domain-containing protein [Fretibacterium sp.]